MTVLLGASMVGILGGGAAEARGQTVAATLDIAEGWEALRGRTAFDISALVSDELKPFVSEASIEAAALGQLRRAGITATRWVARETVRPVLLIAIEGTSVQNHVVYGVSVEYYALLQIPGMSAERLIKGAVYKTGFHGVTSIRTSASSVAGSLSRAIDAFLENAYFKANASHLAARRLTVQRSDWRGHATVPKGGRSRQLPMT